MASDSIMFPQAFGAEVFDKHPYDKLTVKGRDVVDVGAFVGDSAVLRAARARRVIAFEPFPLTFKMATENLRLNTFDNIVLVNEAITSKDGSITIDAMKEISSGNSADYFQDGTRVPSSSLTSIAKRFGLSNASLKLDCEGGEYEILGTATEDSLRPFSEIILEFHNGYPDLLSKLTGLGYRVEIIEQHHGKAGTMLATKLPA